MDNFKIYVTDDLKYSSETREAHKTETLRFQHLVMYYFLRHHLSLCRLAVTEKYVR